MFDLKKLTSFDWVMVGFILHALGGMFFDTSKALCYLLCAVGLIIIFYNAVFQMQFQKPFNGIMLVIFILFLLWTAIILLRPFLSRETFSSDGYSLINRYTWLSFITPLIVFLGFGQVTISSVFKFTFVQGIIGIVLLILNYKQIFQANEDIDVEEYQTYIGVIYIPLQYLFASSFMILCSEFLSVKYRVMAYFTMFTCVFLALYSARRGNLFMYLLIVLFAFILNIAASKGASKLLKLGIVAVTILFAILLFNIYAGSTFALFLARLEEDTRTGVEEYFYYSFQGESLDWLIGRGLNGTYYCPIFDMSSVNRGMIETGYLHLILKGGILYLGLFCFLILHSAYLGLFRSNNIMTKGMAFYLVAHIIFLLPFGLPAFNFEYIVLWICVLYCQSKEFRMCSNTEIKLHLAYN